VARGARVAPSVFSFDTNSTHAIWPRSAGLRNFFAVGKLSAAEQDHPCRQIATVPRRDAAELGPHR
jgi:hypothetical protein